MRFLPHSIIIALSMAVFGCNNSNTPDKAGSEPTEGVTASSASSEGASSEGEGTASSTLPADAPTYNIATISTFTPFVFRDENGNTTGFDVDILKAIGENQGFYVNYLVVPWEGIFDTVNSGSHDIISSAVVITPERQQLVDFSQPYIESGRMAVVNDKYKDASIYDLKDLRFVTQAGTSNIPIVESLVSDPKNIQGVDTQYLEIQKVLTGEADVAFDDSRVMEYYVNQNPDLYGIPYEDYAGDKLGFAVKKGRQDLLAKINAGLAQIKSDGTYDKIYKKWFGNTSGANTSSNMNDSSGGTANNTQ